jgi:anti-anti-sigma factor
VSTFEVPRPATPDRVIKCHSATFATRWLHPTILIVSAHGELDAANAQDFAEYALQHTDAAKRLLLDLTDIEFFGTAGFSALHTLNVRCAAIGADWAMMPSRAVTRLLGICDPDATLPVAPTIATALALIHGEPRQSLLQLVPEPR